MPTVGTDWYPVVIDSYTTAEYADLDAYLASEYGSELLPGCGCSAVVPLATATQRLADNGININVIVPQTLFNRTNSAGTKTALVYQSGQLVNFMEGQNVSFFIWEADAQRYAVTDSSQVSDLLPEWSTTSLGAWTFGLDKTVTVDGVEYTFKAQGNYYTLEPKAGTYNG